VAAGVLYLQDRVSHQTNKFLGLNRHHGHQPPTLTQGAGWCVRLGRYQIRTKVVATALQSIRTKVEATGHRHSLFEEYTFKKRRNMLICSGRPSEDESVRSTEPITTNGGIQELHGCELERSTCTGLEVPWCTRARIVPMSAPRDCPVGWSRGPVERLMRPPSYVHSI
jgi:hypothetical protein